MIRFITIFSFIFVVSLLNAQVEHTFGLGTIIARNSDVIYFRYDINQDPFWITPPRRMKFFFPANYRMRIPFYKKNGNDISATFPIHLNGSYTNSPFKRRNNFMVMQIPFLISCRIGENGFGKKLGFSTFVSAGASFLRTSGRNIGQRNQFDPYFEGGIRKIFGSFGFGITYGQNFIFADAVQVGGPDNYLKMPQIKWKTQTISGEVSFHF